MLSAVPDASAAYDRVYLHEADISLACAGQIRGKISACRYRHLVMAVFIPEINSYITGLPCRYHVRKIVVERPEAICRYRNRLAFRRACDYIEGFVGEGGKPGCRTRLAYETALGAPIFIITVFTCSRLFHTYPLEIMVAAGRFGAAALNSSLTAAVIGI